MLDIHGASEKAKEELESEKKTLDDFAKGKEVLAALAAFLLDQNVDILDMVSSFSIILGSAIVKFKLPLARVFEAIETVCKDMEKNNKEKGGKI